MANKTDPRINIMFDNVSDTVKEVLSGYDYRTLKNPYKDPHIIIAGTERYSKDMIDRFESLLVISRAGSGIDNIDFKACKYRNITILRTAEEPAESVAEFTISGMIRALRRSDLSDFEYKYVGRDLSECVVGIVGMGSIGSKVYNKLRLLNTKNILHNDININLMPNHDLDDILAEADIITFHIPLKDEKNDNWDFIKYKQLQKMKRDCVVVNTSRGGIINETDMYKWLLQNPMATAVFDVFDNEPDVNKKLYKLGNMIATPHIASYTRNTLDKMMISAIKNGIRVFYDKNMQ